MSSHKRADVEKAYQLQTDAGIRGGIRYGLVGLGVITTAHCFSPRFARHTLAIKGFLVMGFAVTGLVFEAESALMAYEREMRVTESALRKEARIDLARRGIVGTETEIARWKSERLEAAQAQSAPSGVASESTAA